METRRRGPESRRPPWLARASRPQLLQWTLQSSFCRRGLGLVRLVDAGRQADGPQWRQCARVPRRRPPEQGPAGLPGWLSCAALPPGSPQWPERWPLDQQPAIPWLLSRPSLRRSAARSSARVSPVLFRQPCCLNTMDKWATGQRERRSTWNISQSGTFHKVPPVTGPLFVHSPTHECTRCRFFNRSL